MGKVRSHAVNLVLLGLFCLMVEQVGYCLFIPGYVYKLVTSAVFWGSVSGFCFLTLWWIDRCDGHLQSAEEPVITNEEYGGILDFMFNNPMSLANPNNLLPKNLGGWW